MSIKFSKSPIKNLTTFDFVLNPHLGYLSGAGHPNGTATVEGLSDNITRLNDGGPPTVYEWPPVDHLLQPGQAGSIESCTDQNLHVVLRGGGLPDETIVATRYEPPAMDQAAPAEAAATVGTELEVLRMEYDRADFGSSYDALSFSFPGNTAVEKTVVEEFPIDQLEFDIKVADSEKTLSREISFSVSASANILGAEISASASLLSRVDMKATSVALVCKENIPLGFRQLSKSGLKLTQRCDDEMKQNPAEFYKQYGTHFISGAYLGGDLTIVMTKDYQSLGEKLQAAASAKAKYGSYEGSAEFKSAMESFSANSNVSMNIQQSGWMGPIPDMDSKQVIAYAQEFPDHVKQAPDKSTYEIELTPFTSVASSEASKAFRDVVGPVFKVTGDFVDAITAYKDALESIAYVDSIGLGVQSDLRKWESDINYALDELKVVWHEHRRELSLPAVKTVLAEKQINPPDFYIRLVRELLQDTPVLAGTPIFLRYMSGQIVSNYKEVFLGRAGTKEYCPNVGDKGVQLRLSVLGNEEVAIRSGQTLTVETMEQMPEGQDTCRTLSAFSDHYLYYYYPGQGKHQQWRIETVDNSPIVNFGAKVRLINAEYEQQLFVEPGDSGTGLTTSPLDKAIHWVIDKG